jgi:beta-RFAP synthase
MSERGTVFVEAPARLHMGLLDLAGDLGRRFGGLGAAVAAPSLLLEARPAERLSAEGPESERLLLYARRYLDRQAIRGGASLRLQRAIPAHAGLGSGTQIALATARALAALFDQPTQAPALAIATGRAQRSAVGTWVFERGGFVLEGGRDARDAPAPLLLQRELPAAWRCLVAIPDVPQGVSGAAEAAAFEALAPPPGQLTGRIARLVLMALLPALVEEDLPAFGRGITELQALVGEMFRPVQGERFAHPEVAALVAALLAEGAAGAGQSSWGPAVFGLFPGAAEAQRAADRLRARLAGAPLFVTAFDNRGARCWTA